MPAPSRRLQDFVIATCPDLEISIRISRLQRDPPRKTALRYPPLVNPSPQISRWRIDDVKAGMSDVEADHGTE